MLHDASEVFSRDTADRAVRSGKYGRQETPAARAACLFLHLVAVYRRLAYP